MRYTLITVCVAAITIMSCAKQKEPELEEGLKLKSFIVDTSALFSRSVNGFAESGEDLPRRYVRRKFIDLAGMSYNISEFAGHVVRYNPKDTSYSIIDITRSLKQGYPRLEMIEDGLIYNKTVTSNASFNGSVVVGSIKIGAKSSMEFLIQDIAVSIVSDSLIDEEAIKSKYGNLPDSLKERTFFVKSALLSYVNYKTFDEMEFTADVNYMFATIGGKTYGSNTTFSKERMVSMDLYSLADIMNK
jgi:hypothetical protein